MVACRGKVNKCYTHFCLSKPFRLESRICFLKLKKDRNGQSQVNSFQTQCVMEE